ncbi:MAG: transporter substrate-binding domain-containing protein [Actinomycetota bacterium]|nr:transporter substrate-binding domain-containing protein [Actinomycetota bacterium]
MPSSPPGPPPGTPPLPRPSPPQPPEPPTNQPETGARRGLVGAVAGIGIALILAAVAVSSLSKDSKPNPQESAMTTVPMIATTTIPATTTPPATAPARTAPTTNAPSTTVTTTTASTPTAAPPTSLTVGHSVGRVPFQSRDREGNLIGFEVDLINELVARLGTEATWVETDSPELRDGTEAGRYDVAVAGMVVTDYLLERMLFTTPYFIEQYGLIVDPLTGPTITSFASLTAADTIGVTDGTHADLWAGTNLAPLGVEILRFENGEAEIDALCSGEVDGLVSSVMYRYISSGRLEQFDFVDAAPSGGIVAFGVDPAKPEVLAWLDATLAAMIDDGTYQQIYDRWFDDGSASVAP